MAGESQLQVTISYDERRAKILERAINQRNDATQIRQEAAKYLQEAKDAEVRAHGKVDGIIETIAEEEGYDFNTIESASTDTEQRKLILFLKPESVEGLHLVSKDDMVNRKDHPNHE